MTLTQRMAALLALGTPLLPLAPHSIVARDRQTVPAIAQAQGSPPPARIEFYLPPARVTPPAAPAQPLRRPLARRVAAEPVGPQVEQMAGRDSRQVWKQGLFTVSRTGRRLLYRKGYQDGVPVHLVIADLSDPEIKIGVMIARGGIGTTESFESMVRRAEPAAAITGTFFGVHNGLPTGDLVVNGHAIYQGFVGTAIAFTEGNLVSFIPTGYKQKTSWRWFDGVMRSGPLLIQAGRIAVGPKEEGFTSLSPAARRPRTAVGITADRKLLLLAVKEPISLWTLAKLMRELGAFHAVAMDGGTSTGLYFRGQVVARPGRALTNALVIYAYRKRYQQARGAFLGHSSPQRPSAPAATTPAAASAPTLAIELRPAGPATPPAADRLQPVAAPPEAALLPAPPAPATATGLNPGGRAPISLRSPEEAAHPPAPPVTENGRGSPSSSEAAPPSPVPGAG